MAEAPVGPALPRAVGAALVLEIADQLHKLATAPQTDAGLLRIALVLGVGGLLLVNQLAELAERVERRRDGRR